MIQVKEANEIRKRLGLDQIIIFGLDKNGQHVATHGKTVQDAKVAAKKGNELKRQLGWPEKLCNSEPLERTCGNCSYWQAEYHRPGDVMKENRYGGCMYATEKIHRFEKDRACVQLEPNA
jgi:hypothetical protein